ncbi:MAG: hypothetical protein KKA54_17385 [Proteobacteria bacterium]|nr:hypothetical protein [Pseudomonadota bacterium]MBU0968141.1 hypothetical protein [Pseudomonadota bacterium]
MIDKQKRGRYTLYLALCLILYVAAVLGYTSWSNQRHKHIIMAEIDQQLLLAAKALKFMLAPDFHDRAMDKDSISFAEELRNRKAITGYADNTDFTYVYTLVEQDGKFYFSAPTVTEEEAKERKSWYFYPYDDIPAGFVEAFREKKTVFINYSDKWGRFRSIALPQTSPGGRTYLACADYQITDMDALLRHNLVVSILTAFYFFLGSLPFILFFRNFFRSYNAELQEINVELTEHKAHLEEVVVERTSKLQAAHDRLASELVERRRIEADLQEKKHKLEEALAQVKTLRGFLPICSSCKKIRDDKGYWKQIETYVREHSDAQFSHSVCPECARRIYPDLDIDEIEKLCFPKD